MAAACPVEMTFIPHGASGIKPISMVLLTGVMAAINYTDSMFEIINLGNNRTVQLLELVEAIEGASGIEAEKHTVRRFPVM